MSRRYGYDRGRWMTLAEAREALRAAHMTIRKRDHEYRVNFEGGKEASAYYTNDLRDALETGKLMARSKK